MLVRRTHIKTYRKKKLIYIITYNEKLFNTYKSVLAIPMFIITVIIC